MKNEYVAAPVALEHDRRQAEKHRHIFPYQFFSNPCHILNHSFSNIVKVTFVVVVVVMVVTVLMVVVAVVLPPTSVQQRKFWFYDFTVA